MSIEQEENYLPLVQYTLNNFEIDEDVQKWKTIQHEIDVLNQSRQQKLDDIQTHLKSLSRKLEAAKSTYEESEQIQRQSTISEEIKQLDKRRYSLAKTINELEQSNASSLAIIDQKRQELRMLESQDPIEQAADNIDDATILKLRIYRSLGISLEPGSDNRSIPLRALIQNTSNGNVEIFNLDEKYSASFVANHLWERI